MADAAKTHIWLHVVDSDKRAVPGARARVREGGEKLCDLALSGEGVAELDARTGESLTFEAEAPGFAGEVLTVRAIGRVQQIVLGLRRDGELSYDQGDSRFAFRPDRESYLLFTSGENARERIERLVGDGAKMRFVDDPQKGDAAQPPPADVAVVRVAMGMDEAAALAAQAAQGGLDVQLTRALDHEGHLPFGLTNEVVVRFRSDVERASVDRIAAEFGFEIAREIRHAGNAYLFVRPGVPDYDVLESARRLSERPETVYVEPNLAFIAVSDQYIPNDVLWANLPHLPLINCDDAWDRLDNVDVSLRGGSAAITVGVVDLNGVAPDHPDLIANLTDGTGKMVANWNFKASPITPQTVAGLGTDHGTECAGSATAAFDNNRGICGVAPNCHLIGARVAGAAAVVAMADLYMWMAGFMNGSTAPGFPAAPPPRPADVISSSWGSDGLALSNTLRDCFDFIAAFGRGGRGCVLCFSLGNTGYLDFTNPAGIRHRAWPTYEKTIAVGASISANPTNPTSSVNADPSGATTGIATQVDRRALYSPYGATALRKPDLVAPSHTAYASDTLAKVDPIMATVRVGTGAVDGCTGTPCFDYASSFGGTSHSTPTVAGAIALMLSARPQLSWIEVRDILRRTCVRIDAANADAIGQWQDLDTDGAIDYSRWYGSGRLDVDAAVQRALDPATPYADCYVRENLSDVGDVPSPGWHAHSPDIWVRKNDSAIPALAWTSDPPHENPERGQDNHVFCRTRNRGTAAAGTIYLRASITHFPGFEFRYPQEFQPTVTVGGAASPMTLGTYLIGEVQIDDLGIDEDRIVHMVWPEALVPPLEVTVGASTVLWHPCLLLEVSPHDGPGIDASVIAVRGSNNLAQRNIAIDDDNPDSSSDGSWFGIVAGSQVKGGIDALVVDGSRLRGTRRIRVGLIDPGQMRHFAEAAMGSAEPGPGAAGPIAWPPSGPLAIAPRTMRDPHGQGCCGLLAKLGFGWLFRPICGRPPRISVKGSVDDAHIEIDGLGGSVELPLALPAGALTLLRASMGAGASGELRLTQRRGDGQTSAGYSIVR